MAQVKFYSVASLPATPDAGGVYFVDNGELYKGSQRFGLGRVTVAESTASIEGAARGDIVVTGSGAGWVYDGTNWQSIGGDIASLQSMWQADISTWTAGLVQSGSGSYITGITQAADGKVTASASNFALDVQTAVGGGSATSTANGITVDVVTTSGVVTGVTVSASALDVTSISAASGTFTNLNVTDTATFSATTVSADTLTIGGSTVEQLADKQIAAIAASTASSTATGITVSVTTQGGSVTAVALNAEAFANAMHYLGVGSVVKQSDGSVVVTPPQGTTPVAGDIVIDSTTGLEAIYNGTTWELIGDNAVYALNAYSSTATVFANVETVPGALNAAGAAIDALKTKTDAYVGGSASDADQGVAVTVSIDASTLAPSVDVVVTSSTLFAGLDASVSSSENSSIKVGVTQVDGKVTGVTADLLWLGADGNPIDGGAGGYTLTVKNYAAGGPMEGNVVTVVQNGESHTYTDSSFEGEDPYGEGLTFVLNNVTEITSAFFATEAAEPGEAAMVDVKVGDTTISSPVFPYTLTGNTTINFYS